VKPPRRCALVATLLAASLSSQGASPAPQAETTNARTLLSRLDLQTEGGSTTYERTYFQHWVDADRDSCDTREEVLIAESQTTVSPGDGCQVSRGTWYSSYDGLTWTAASDVDIDHVIALKEAWESGARSWSPADRRRFANDLDDGRALAAVTDNVNASKGDRDPAQWLPPRTGAHCDYATVWVVIKYRWRLSIDTAERDRLSSLLSGACGSTTVVVPARAL